MGKEATGRRLREARISHESIVRCLRLAGLPIPDDCRIFCVHASSRDQMNRCAVYVFESEEFDEIPELAEPSPWPAVRNC